MTQSKLLPVACQWAVGSADFPWSRFATDHPGRVGCNPTSKPPLHHVVCAQQTRRASLATDPASCGPVLYECIRVQSGPSEFRTAPFLFYLPENSHFLRRRELFSANHIACDNPVEVDACPHPITGIVPAVPFHSALAGLLVLIKECSDQSSR